ncbi:MAG: hypothetical protein JWM10_3258 [Myxococcaceae bacterium]|nr:hypothetical protein [Myxococcaceae bacterium]
MTEPAAVFVVLTEDTGGSGWKPVVTCIRAMCDLLISGIDWSGVQTIPREDTGAVVLRSLGVKLWRGRGGLAHQSRVRLAQYLADQLINGEGAPRLVFFHLDADLTWKQGGADQSTTVRQFRDQIEPAIRFWLNARRAVDLDALMQRLHLVVPAYSIESWLYQSTERAAELCRERTCAGAHVAQYDAWAADRSLLDDVAAPKDQRALHCLIDADKETLADTLPVAALRAAGRSFARTFDALADDGALLHALIATPVHAPDR